MENVRELIKSVKQNFTDAFFRADAAGIAALYTDDAKLLAPGVPMMTGKEAVQSFYQGAMEMGIKEARFDTVEVESAGNLVCEIGKFALTVQSEGGESSIMTGKYVQVYKNQDGNLKVYIDTWNDDAS
jgi:uncharacterized protein (TIGR02246 family)